MSYINNEMPPVIRLTDYDVSTNETTWNLEGQGGTVVVTKTTNGVNHPDDWWDEMVNALVNASTTEEAAHDMVRLNAFRDWEVIDET